MKKAFVLAAILAGSSVWAEDCTIPPTCPGTDFCIDSHQERPAGSHGLVFFNEPGDYVLGISYGGMLSVQRQAGLVLKKGSTITVQVSGGPQDGQVIYNCTMWTDYGATAVVQKPVAQPSAKQCSWLRRLFHAC